MTDTFEKSALEEEQRIRDIMKQKIAGTADTARTAGKVRKAETARQVGKKLKKATQSKPTPPRNLKTVRVLNFNDDSSSDAEDESLCLVCNEKHHSSEEPEDWLKCNQCEMWAHVSCSKENPYYVCINCDSD